MKFNTRHLIVSLFLLPSLFVCSQIKAQSNWQKVQLNPDFYSEGISAGDFNKDGHVDIVAGPFIYPGPEFKTKKEYTRSKETPWSVNGDSDNYLHFVFDIDNDGWLDILWQKRWDDTLNWYGNPQLDSFPDSRQWNRSYVSAVVSNESPAFEDIAGDTVPEVICLFNNKLGYFRKVPEDSWTRWPFIPISGEVDYEMASHGLGVGDLNGDGKKDILEKNGWWEHTSPEELFIHHPFAFYGNRYPAEGTGGAQMLVYDVDDDGDNDVISSLQAHGYDLAWFENLDGSGESFDKHMIMGTPQEGNEYGAAFSQLHALALADINGDGLKDIVTGKRKGAHGADPNEPAILAWFELSRDGGEPSYIPHIIDEEAGTGTQISVMDVNGDGRLDILTSARAGAFVFINNFAVVGLATPKKMEASDKGSFFKGAKIWFQNFWYNLKGQKK